MRATAEQTSPLPKLPNTCRSPSLPASSGAAKARMTQEETSNGLLRIKLWRFKMQPLPHRPPRRTSQTPALCFSSSATQRHLSIVAIMGQHSTPVPPPARYQDASATASRDHSHRRMLSCLCPSTLPEKCRTPHPAAQADGHRRTVSASSRR